MELKAIVYSKSGNKAQEVIKVIPDYVPPVLYFKAPKHGDFVKKEFTVETEAKDDNGISKVELYLQGQKIAEKLTSPYTFVIDLNTVQIPKIGTPNIENVGREIWKAKLNTEVWSSPTLARDGTMYIGTYDGFVYSLSPSGQVKWKFQTNGRIHASPSISNDGTIYVANLNGYLYALYPDGSLK